MTMKPLYQIHMNLQIRWVYKVAHVILHHTFSSHPRLSPWSRLSAITITFKFSLPGASSTTGMG